MDTNQHRFAMFVDLQDVPALVVGGGPVALRKTRRLIDAGAKVTVVAPSQQEAFTQLVNDGVIVCAQREFIDCYLQWWCVPGVIAITYRSH